MKKLILSLSVSCIALSAFSQENDKSVIKNNQLSNGGINKVVPPVTYVIPACVTTNGGWLLGGNSMAATVPAGGYYPGGFGGGQVLGTCDAWDMILEAGGVSSMWIKPSGKLGIGVGASNPGGQLDIVTSGTTNGLNILNGTSNLFSVASDGTTLINSTGSSPFTVQKSGVTLFQINTSGNISIGSIKGTSTTGGYNSVLVDPTGKLVTGGIVNSTNSVSWNVGGNAGVGGTSGTLGTTDAEDLIFVAGAGGPVTGIERMRITAAGNAYMTVNSATAKAFSVVNSSLSSSCGNEMFAVYGSGQTLIGGHLTSGAYTNALLQVKGQIAAEEVHVLAASFWCDYVFDKEYKLKPLAELEAYYKQNKHLPDVPSEAEVKANGIDMATMDAVLLKKVEESTLYIVQQQKEMDAMKEEMKSMKKENEEMKNALNKILKK